MRKKIVSAFIAAFVLVSAAGCGSNTPATQVQEEIVETSKEDEVVELATTLKKAAVETDGTKENLEECLALMGKDDASSAAFLGGGKENIAADGETLIGRIYLVTLFDEEAEVATMYDGNNCVYVISVQLKNPDASSYASKLKELYGEPSEVCDTWDSGGKPGTD